MVALYLTYLLFDSCSIVIRFLFVIKSNNNRITDENLTNIYYVYYLSLSMLILTNYEEKTTNRIINDWEIAKSGIYNL